MRHQQSSPSSKLLEVGRIGVNYLLREPVKQAVREALAEERALADGRERALSSDQRPPRRPEDTEQETEQDGSVSRIRRPAMLLAVLGLVAAAALMKREQLLGLVESEEFLDQADDDGSPTVANQRSTTHDDPIGTGESPSGVGDDEPVERSAAADTKEYQMDTENDGISTTE